MATTRKRTARKYNPTDWHGPRVVGGTYRSAYWGDTYTVLSASVNAMTVQWSDGHQTTHGTAWDRRDSIVSQP